MTRISKTLITTGLALTMAAPASAMISKAACLAIYSAAGSNSGIVVNERGSTIIVSGHVDHQFEVNAVRRAAEESGAENVIIRVIALN